MRDRSPFDMTSRTLQLVVALGLMGSIARAPCLGAQAAERPNMRELAYGEREIVKNLNPYSLAFPDATTDRYLSMLYEPLFRWNFLVGTAEPVLAQKMSSTKAAGPGLFSYIVELKPRVRWHDSTAFAATDVVFTWDYIRQKWPSRMQREAVTEVIANVQPVTPSNPLQVRVDFKQNVSDPAMYLDFPIIPASRFVQPSFDAADRNRQLSSYPIGTGPFRQTPGTSALGLSVNKFYHGDVGRIQSILASEYNDASSMVEDFLTVNGPINMIVEVPDKQLRLVEASKRQVRAERMETYKIHAIALRQTAGSGLQNARVRRAIAMAIDREKIRENWFVSRGQVLAGPFTPGSKYFDATLEALPFDVVAAKAELRSAGVSVRPLRLIYKSNDASASSLESDVALSVKAALEAIGINVTLKSMMPSPFKGTLFNEHETGTAEWDMAVVLMELNPTEDIAPFFHSRNIKQGGSNFMRFKNERVDFLLDEANRAEDAPRKRSVLQQAGRMLRDSVPVVFIVNEETSFASTSDLIIPEGTRDPFNFFTYVNMWRWSARSGR